MIEKVRYLLPINRSLSGEGNRKTLSYLEKLNPDLKRIKFLSGTKVFDWKIPLEWNIKDSYIEHISSKKKFAKLKSNNLHIVSY